MTDHRNDDAVDNLPEDVDTNPDSPPEARDDDARSDIERAVEARSDALKRGEGGPEPETLIEPGMPDGVGGTGGVTKNQGGDAQ